MCIHNSLKFVVWLLLLKTLYSYDIPLQSIESYSSEVAAPPTLILDNLQLTLSSKLLLDVQSPSGKTLHGYLGWLPKGSSATYTGCSDNSHSEAMCFKYAENMTLTIRSDNVECDSKDTACQLTSCHKVQWKYHMTGAMDCFLLGDDGWYGGGERLVQRWPLQDDSRPWHAFVTGDPAHHPAGGVLENLWLTSTGFLIFVDRDVPLFLSLNESNSGKLCFSTSLKKYPYNAEHFKQKELSYTVCASKSVKEAYLYASKRWLGHPTDIPDERMLLEPIWSTWARYKADVDVKKVLDFSKEIYDHNFPGSHIEIDDKWQSCYGSLDFDRVKFPDPADMIEKIHNMGFRVTLWVHPFCNVECDCFKVGESHHYWIKNANGDPALVNWWNGQAGMLDTTNDDAAQWYMSRLENLKSKYKVDAFKFDAGEVSWLPEGFVLFDKAAVTQPSLFTKKYTEIAAKFGGLVEVRSAWNSQHLPIFIRIYDKESKWSYDNGLKTLIPTALHFSQMGYSFILPDMVGGNNYGAQNGTLPNSELYLRWLQANAFLPAIQFSILPWDYDEYVTSHAALLVELHRKFGSYILKTAQESTSTGAPMIRPLWWISPDDPTTWFIDSQFLLGDKLMVAPILEYGMRQRDIYVPEGRWADMLRGGIVEGPQHLRNYDVSLTELSFFLLQ